MNKHVAIIGGGVIGLFCAWFLVRDGYRVTVVDENNGDSTSGCSFGNAGLIVPSHLMPLAAPGMIAKGMKWLMRTDSPFYIKPRTDMALAKWMYRFQQAATAKKAQLAMPVLSGLLNGSSNLHRQICNEIGVTLQQTGLRMLYRTEAGKQDELALAARAAQFGVSSTQLSANEVQDQEAKLKTDVLGAVVYPGDSSLIPQELMRALSNSLKYAGVQFLWNTRVRKLDVEGRHITGLNDGAITANEFVLAGGSWSGELARQVGVNILLEAGKGYGINIENTTQQISMPTILSEAKVSLTPMGSNLRLGGTMELAGMDQTISSPRVEAIRNSAIRYFPNLDKASVLEQKPWAGLRPCSPDGLPYIGRTSKVKNLTLASGHAMLGVSLGPITGEMVAAAISGKPHKQSSKLISVDRFA